MHRELEVVSSPNRPDQQPGPAHEVILQAALQDTETVLITIAGKDGPAVNVYATLTLSARTTPDDGLRLVVRVREVQTADGSPEARNLHVVH
jgi:hypothetical protein